MFPLVEPRQRPERFLLNRFSPLAESAAFLGLGGFDAAGSVWYPDATQLLGRNPSHGTLTNMDPATDWVWSPELGRWIADFLATSNQSITAANAASIGAGTSYSLSAWVRTSQSAIGIGVMEAGPGTGSGNYGPIMQINNGYARVACNGKMAQVTALTADGQWHHLLAKRVGQVATIVVDAKETVTVTHADVANAFERTAFRVGWWGHVNYDLTGSVADAMCWERDITLGEISALADPSNVMLEVGGVPLILPPRRVSFPAAVAEPSGFKPYWLRRSTQIIGGGVA